MTSTRNGPLDRLWDLLTRPAVIGMIVAGAGLLLMVAPLSVAPDQWASTWWTQPFRQPGVLEAAVGLLAAVAVLGGGVLVHRVLHGGASAIGIIGLMLVGAGAATGTGHWYWLQDAVPPARLTLQSNAPVQAFQTDMAGKSVDVMLPLRVEITDIRLGTPPSFGVRTFQAGGETVLEARLGPGDSLPVGDYRLTAVGLDSEKGALRAVLQADRPRTIPAAAAPGQTFRFSPDGEEYELLEVAENYMGAMGPAARVSQEDIGKFWVFERAPEAEPTPSFIHDLSLDRLEQAPAAVLLVSKATPLWPITLAGSLIVLGVIGALFFPAGGPLAAGRRDEKDGLNGQDDPEDNESGGEA